ncbi:hypothetical protein N7470_008968 [Penicillium chermesinum]|nr:hypothetical protein N7470_008968 [Penicillium chermesinum]
MKSRMSAFEFEETDSEAESEDEPDSHDQADEKPRDTAIVTVQVTESDKKHQSAPLPEHTPIKRNHDSKDNFCSVTVQPIAA